VRSLNKALSDVIGGQLRPFDLIGNQGHKPDIDDGSLVAQYRSWGYVCAQRNAVGIASTPLRVFATRASNEPMFRAKGQPITKSQREHLQRRRYLAENARFKAAEEIIELDEHPLSVLFQNMNPWHNEFDMTETLSLYMDLTGDAFWYVKPGPLGIPEEIWTLPTQWVRVVPDKDKYIKGYLFGRDKSNPTRFTPDEVVWFTRPNPKDPFSGMGRIEGTYWAVKGYESMERYELNQTENHGMQQLLVNYKDVTLNAKKRRDAMSEWANAIRASSRDRAPLIGDRDIELQPVEWSPREISFLKGREWRKEEIINAFGQHPALYSKNANTANIQGAIHIWEKYELQATLDRVAQKLNEQLVPKYNEPRLFVAFDSPITENREQQRQDDDLLLKNGYPLNRVLAERGLDPVEGGDIGYIPGTLIQLGTTGTSDPEAGATELAKASQRGSALRLSGAPENCECEHAGKDAFDVGVTKAETVDRPLTGGANPAITEREAEVMAGLEKVWTAQTTLALREVPKMVGADFSWVASETWAQEIVDLTGGALKEEVLIGAGKGARKVGVQVTDFIDRPHVQDALRNHHFAFARAVNQTSADNLQKAMADGIANGESIPELTNRVKAAFGGVDPKTGEKIENWRAERVARSESARSQMLGVEQQWKESGVVAKKVWDANGDACPFCLDMEGKTVEIGNAFWSVDGANQTVEFRGKDITLKHEYLDVLGPPLHPNCRCSLKPEFVEF
jgi:HK97 family phage portal protein